MTDLVKLVKDVPLASTLDIAEGLEADHRAILFLIKKYESEFQEIRTFAADLRKSGGKPTVFYWFDEEQATYLVTLMKNSKKVRQFKRKLTGEFIRLRKLLSSLAAQQQNAEWLESRNTGKISRKLETDRIKDFVDYATAQGSTKASFYYATISKMQNKALFLLEQKFPNLRDILDIRQLNTIREADEIVIKALNDGMNDGLHYRDIYQLAKTRIEMFSEIRGKSLIPAMQLTTRPEQKLLKAQ